MQMHPKGCLLHKSLLALVQHALVFEMIKSFQPLSLAPLQNLLKHSQKSGWLKSPRDRINQKAMRPNLT
jgi:hypothetical protein